jgi:TonB-dependent receptor
MTDSICARIGRVFRLLSAAAALPALALLPVAAQSATSTGTLTGRVQNEVTGQYLNNARVSLKGLDRSTLTDEFGTYQFAQVPSGQVVIEVFYSGLDPKQATVNVPAGQRVEQNFDLTNKAVYGDSSGTVKLSAFVLSASKLTEGEALATNEQRFAANIKNVVATDAYGDVTEGNVAEFMKFLPGITVEYSDVMPLAVSVRGLDPNMTNVTSDGATMANASRNATSRQFDFMQVSINNVSRIEVTKVPTPANPASGLSGSVNMVSKSAFERSRAQFNYRVFMSASSDGMQLKKQPFPFDTYERRVNPGFDFDYTLPISKNFGIVVTGLRSKAWNEQNISAKTWNATAANTGASPSRPFLQTHNIIDAPKWYVRNSLGFKADWRVSQNSVLSLGLQSTYYQDVNGNVSRAVSVGTNPAPTPASGQRLEFGDTYSRSASGRGTVTMGGGTFRIDARTLGANLKYRFDNGDWKFEAVGFASNSKTWLHSLEKGLFNNMGIALLNPAGVRVFMEDIQTVRPGTIRVFDGSNREIDIFDLRNFRLNTATAGADRDHTDETSGGDANIRRSLKVLNVPLNLQVGGAYKIQERDHRRKTRTFTYNPVNPADPTPVPFQAQVYKNRENYFGFDNIPWVATANAVTAWGQNPNLFYQTPAQVVAQEQSRIVGTEAFKETTTAFYAQAEARFLRNRLTVLTGVRYEKVHDKAGGPLFEPANVWQRDAAGNFIRNAAGQRIRRPDAGAVGSMEELRLVRKELGNTVNREDDGFYPSLHFTYNATENLIFRAAYAATYGPPDFNNLIPNATINEADLDDETADPSAVRGNITIRNPTLKPWTADNYDLSAEYYTESGGVFSAGVFRKDITDFFGQRVSLATAEELADLGLDPRYVGWQLNTTINVGDARVTGMEFNVRQSLAPFGRFGRYFSVFANATKLKLKGSALASFTAFLPETVNWGVTITRNPVTLMLKWHHRGEQRRAASAAQGPGAFLYFDQRTTLDVNLTYQVFKRHSFFINGRNIFNEHFTQSRYGPETPHYAKRSSTNSYGVQWSAGIKGTF